MYQSSPIKDDVLKSYIEQIFTRYDTNSTGTLNPNEMTSFFNDLFRSLNIPLALSAQQSLEAIKAVYPAYNGTVNRDELFAAFKVLLGMYQCPHSALQCRSRRQSPPPSRTTRAWCRTEGMWVCPTL